MDPFCSLSTFLFPLLFDCQININNFYLQTPFHLFPAGLVAVGMSCVYFLDETQQEETQQCIQCVVATMSAIVATTQESTYNSGFDNNDDADHSEMKRHKYFHWDREWAKQNIQLDYLCTNPIFNETGSH